MNKEYLGGAIQDLKRQMANAKADEDWETLAEVQHSYIKYLEECHSSLAREAFYKGLTLAQWTGDKNDYEPAFQAFLKERALKE